MQIHLHVNIWWERAAFHLVLLEATDLQGQWGLNRVLINVVFSK
jgi:hypothetical protein